MRRVVEKISNGISPNINKTHSISEDVIDFTKEIYTEIVKKGEAIKSLARLGGDNRKGTIIVYLPESVRYEVRRNFNLSQEPSEFVIQCRSGKDTENNEVILVTVGFSTGSTITDAQESWFIEKPMDGTEAWTIATSQKIGFTLNKLAAILKDLRGRQKR
jgi:hypothetical protein